MRITAPMLFVLLAAPLVGGAAANDPPSTGLERDLDEAKTLYRQAKIAEAIVKIEAAIARLERLRDLQVRRSALADACLGLGLSYFALGDPGSVREILRAAVALDPGRHLDPDIYGPRILALLEQARRDGLAPPNTSDAAAGHAAFGSLSISSTAWIEVSVDGGPPLQTPLSIRRLAVGRHTVRASRPGYRTQLLEVDVQEADTRRLRIDLERAPGFE